MTLQEFLASANADHALALQEAQAYTQISPKMYTANVLTVKLVGAGLYAAIADAATTQGHPVRAICMALMDRLRSEGEFNLSPNHPMGVANGQMLDALIAGIPDHAAALTALKGELLAGADEVRYPFANVTLYDVLTARDAVPTVPVTVGEAGYVVVEATASCPLHSPRILGLNPRTNKSQVVGRLSGVSEAGLYECRIDHPHRPWSLVVEDVYGVIGA